MTDQIDPAGVTPQKVSTRLDGDNRGLVRAVVALVIALGVVSFTAGVPGLMAVGRWAMLEGWMPVLAPLMVDGGLIVMSLVATVRRARGERATFAWACLAVLTAGSVAAQVAHVVVGQDVSSAVIAGAALAAAFPLVVFASTHALLDLAIAPAPKRGVKKGAVPAHVPAGPAVAESVPASPAPAAAPGTTESNTSGASETALPAPAEMAEPGAAKPAPRKAAPTRRKTSSKSSKGRGGQTVGQRWKALPEEEREARKVAAVAAVLDDGAAQTATAERFEMARATLWDAVQKERERRGLAAPESTPTKAAEVVEVERVEGEKVGV